MKIVLTGSTGLIGSALLRQLEADNHQVVRLLRRPPQRPDEMEWDPAAGKLPEGCLAGADAIIHLGGESIQGRWTNAKRGAILESRIRSTALLARSMAAMNPRPHSFLCASAAAYGDRGEEILTDHSDLGQDFLGQVCRAWEAAAATVQRAGIRTVNLRLGMVLDGRRGALAAMLPAFRWGLGGRVGSGRQFWSWITLADTAGAIRHALADENLAGPVNIVSPNPIRQADFARALGRALGRPTILPVSARAVRLAFGEVADALLLASIRAVPPRLLESGFVFKNPDIDEALESILAKAAAA
jgi:hypothetical protein